LSKGAEAGRPLRVPPTALERFSPHQAREPESDGFYSDRCRTSLRRLRSTPFLGFGIDGRRALWHRSGSPTSAFLFHPCRQGTSPEALAAVVNRRDPGESRIARHLRFCVVLADNPTMNIDMTVMEHHNRHKNWPRPYCVLCVETDADGRS
jgi:hypothetical protein